MEQWEELDREEGRRRSDRKYFASTLFTCRREENPCFFMQTGSFKQKTTIREYPTPELVELGKTFKQKLRSPHARETCDGQEVLASQKWGNRGCHCSSSLVTQAAQPKAREGKSAPDGLTGASRTPGTGRQQSKGRCC